jgi:hypothetical protein
VPPVQIVQELAQQTLPAPPGDGVADGVVHLLGQRFVSRLELLDEIGVERHRNLALGGTGHTRSLPE